VLFEPGSATRRVIDAFFLTESQAIVMMDTEVEIIKAMVKTGIGIGIVPIRRLREVGQGVFCARIDGHELIGKRDGSTRRRTACRG
jgi:DNA-binding transcriptional LysR family regulator